MFLLGIFCSNVSAGETINGSITFDEIQRDYILYVPDSYNGNNPVPLIINFHGYTGTAYNQMYYGDFRPIADQNGFLIVHPQGTFYEGKTHWNVGGWTAGSTTDDVGFTNALIDYLGSNYNINSSRVYATGMSNGGFMSFLLACQLGNKIAAIASVTGSMTPETFNDCNPVHPIAILQIHGTSDSVVPYTGISWSEPVEDVLQYWVNANCCNPVPVTTLMPDLDPTDGSTVEHIVYDGGDSGVSVEHFRVIGGDHTWPGTAFGPAGTNHDIDASREIWNFFSRYDINGIITFPSFTVDLQLSKNIFQAGDQFTLTALITNSEEYPEERPLAVLLDVWGNYFWYPTWEPEFATETIHLDIGQTEQIILDFKWPEIEEPGAGVIFYCAIFNQDYTNILGDFDVVEFDWS